MGVNYKQFVVMGIRLDIDDIKVIVNEAVYDEQPRYNTKTGQQTHTEKVLVREEEYVYRWRGFEADDLYDLINAINHQHSSLYCYYGDDCIYIGQPISDPEDYGCVELIDDEFAVSDLIAMQQEIEDELKSANVKLYLFSRIG